ncbi:OLC1v1014674C1 [Oldenlandia corymbosa var. corymbosa]|uniref:OLC1v1014674C1 n=1 Tax=Oldenlandia corymbosa var. corymbosa TaxID=529605 RepID=A0AAV1E4W5_OLDCO|nr:OLC1v1014674C1 [Oldenlandia corymbosa var. corymbosa]
MAADLVFTEEEIAVDGALGYPKAFAKLCKDRSFSTHCHGPPLTFTPYALNQQEVQRAQEADGLFPIIDLNAKPTTKPKIFGSVLWKQLNHLGNAGFDPEKFRVDPYGNVLYYHADAASPLAWDIDHWFPCSRGGLTVVSNLRIIQWQVYKKKNNQLEFLIPWWDLQVGVSINQFLSIFASSNSDFRRRAFSWLFSAGESEELNARQTVDSHAFPRPFVESSQKIGLAPAAIVLSRRGSTDASSVLRSLDMNKKPRSSTPIIAARKVKPGSIENDDPDMVSNPYQAIVIARNSLRQREETAKMQTEIQKLDMEADELRQKAEDEKATIQNLELVLMKRKRKAEKCRRLAEAQSSYRSMLEKMIRDAMHQSVVYKEQVRLNQAAASALMATLEAQKAICDSSERELHKKFKQRDELEKLVTPNLNKTRKRSRTDVSLTEEPLQEMVLYSPEANGKTKMDLEMNDYLLDENASYMQRLKSKYPSHKQLRKFLEEEQKVSDVEPSSFKDEIEEVQENERPSLRTSSVKPGDSSMDITTAEGDKVIDRELDMPDIKENGICNIRFPAYDEPEEEEDEESRKQRGKGNVEKWLQILLKENGEGGDDDATADQENLNPNEAVNKTDEIIAKLDHVYPLKEIRISKAQQQQDLETADQLDNQQLIPVKGISKRKDESAHVEARKSFSNHGLKVGLGKKEMLELKCRDTPIRNPPYKIKPEKKVADHQKENCTPGLENHLGNEKKEKELVRSDSFRAFRRIPSSPSLILSGMKKRVDCIGKKPLVMDDEADGDENYTGQNNILKSTIKTIKRAVKI